MGIEITEFVNANISVSPTGVALGNFGTLGFLTTELGIPNSERYRKYKSLSGVSEDWATSTEVYKAATAFYGQTPTPTDFVALSMYAAAATAGIFGGAPAPMDDIKALGSANLVFSLVGTETTVTVDVSAARDYADVAGKVTAQMTSDSVAATCVFLEGSFVVNSTATGASTTISFATGDLGLVLGLDQAEAVVVNGADAETVIDALAANKNIGAEFVGLSLSKGLRDNIGTDDGNRTTEVGAWCEASKVIFMNTTNNVNSLLPAYVNDVASLLKDMSLRFTMTSFSNKVNQYPCASIFGRAASVNFEGIGTTITLNLKQMPGVSAEKLSVNDLSALKDKNCNVVVAIGKSATGFTSSKMSNGSWFDTTHGLLWLENRIEVDMFNLLYRTNTKIPYSQYGLNIAGDVLERSLAAAVRNGLCAPGVLPDGTYLPEGFVVDSVALADVSSADKSNRVYKGLSFKMVGAGALHEILIDGQFSE